MADSAAEIWTAIQTAHETWLAGRPEGVAKLFHRNVAMDSPDGKEIVRGRDAMVRSYVDYCAHVKTHEFKVLNHAVHVVENTAVAHYTFTVAYEAAGTQHQETGTETLVFVRNGDRWEAIWRSQRIGS